MLAQLKRVDIARLAGISTVLGIDLDSNSARIVPVRKRGNPLDRYKANYFADAPLSCNFPQDSTPEAKGRVIKDSLTSRRVKTRHCVATLRSPGVRTVSVQVPASIRDVGEWISEHAAKILKIPIPLSELELRWVVLESSAAGSILEMIFVRKADLEELREILNVAGLTPLHLSAGPGDVVNCLFVTDPGITEKELTVAYAEGQRITLVPLAHARRKPMTNLPAGLDEATRKRGEEGELLWAGARSFAESSPQDRELKPFNLTPDYALATGLALRGFLPELNPVDFLSDAEREQRVVGLWRMGFKRTAIALGSMLFLLLALQVAASMAFGYMNEQAEHEVNSSHDVLTEVRGLRERVSALEARREGSAAGASQGNLSRVLHQLAQAVPPAVRIDRLQVEARQQDSLRLTLSLSATSRDAVTAFMKQLEQAGFSDVTLIRLSAREGTQHSRSLVAGELELAANPERLP